MEKIVVKFLSAFIIDSRDRKIFRSFFLRFNIFNYFKHKKYYSKLNYKIIPLGQSCIPRVITSKAMLKPYKIFGELTCPFDLSIHKSFDHIVEALQTKFEYYFDDIYYNNDKQMYVNDKKSIIYVHDSHLSLSGFKKLYQKRISNLFYYISLDQHLFFTISLFEKISNEQIINLKSVISDIRKNKPFSIIIINHSPLNEFHVEDKDICIINQNFILSDVWSEELETEDGKIFYNNIINPIKDFIKIRLANSFLI